MNILSLNPNFDKYFSQINFKFSLPPRKLYLIYVKTQCFQRIEVHLINF